MKSTWNPYLLAAFETVFRPWMYRRLGGVHVRGSLEDIPRRRPVVIVANHVSWWDGFLIRELHRKAPFDGPLFTLMRQDQLDRFPFFKKMGVIGLTDEPSGILQALRLLQQRHQPYWLTFFPQGQIWPTTKRPLGFHRGVEMFLRELAPCDVVPVAIHLEPLTQPSPSVFIRVGPSIPIAPPSGIGVGMLETAVEALLDELHDVLAMHGEEAAAAWTSNREIANVSA